MKEQSIPTNPNLIKIEITSPGITIKKITTIMNALKSIEEFQFEVRLSGASYIVINEGKSQPRLSTNEQEELK